MKLFGADYFNLILENFYLPKGFTNVLLDLPFANSLTNQENILLLLNRFIILFLILERYCHIETVRIKERLSKRIHVIYRLQDVR